MAKIIETVKNLIEWVMENPTEFELWFWRLIATLETTLVGIEVWVKRTKTTADDKAFAFVRKLFGKIKKK
jgi:hypothetical protein